MSSPLFVTYSAPTNIAVIKYWGKRDTKRNLPINSSVSVTLNQDDLRAVTTVIASRSFEKDRLWLNGTCVDAKYYIPRNPNSVRGEEDIAASKRVQAVLREMRARAGSKLNDAGEELVAAGDWAEYKIHIVSANSFPTAAGLASSAAGYACMVAALSDLLAVRESYPGELTTIARQGSGSACRSLFGGFVRWDMGEAEDGRDSIALQIADEHHWPDLRVLVFVVSDAKKDTGSTDGMVRSVETSELLGFRAKSVVPERLAAMEAAYLERDFDTFGRLTMMDSNQFHACCLDTYPPVFYMNDVSRRIINLLHRFNETSGSLRAAYTFDAGPNAVVYTRAEDVPAVLAMMLQHFPPPEGTPVSTFVSRPDVAEAASAVEVPEALRCKEGGASPGAVQKVYVSTVGGGPRRLAEEDALANPETGLPR